VDGGYVAECLTESIVTQGDTWEDLRANVKDAVEAFYFDGEKPSVVRIRLVKDEVLMAG
jgi:predicted RNase H-like HicB family nuclease